MFACLFTITSMQAVYIIGFVLLLAYITLTGYNLLWLLHPKVGNLERILSGCHRRSNKSMDALDCPRPVTKDYVPQIRLDMYYDKKARDFSLLMKLLAEQSSGLAQAFRILCVFDKHFQRLWKPRDNKIVVQRPLINTFTLCPEDKGTIVERENSNYSWIMNFTFLIEGKSKDHLKEQIKSILAPTADEFDFETIKNNIKFN